VYSTFTGGPGAYNTVDGSQLLRTFEGAVSFVPTADGPLDNITLKVESFFDGTTGTLGFALDSGSNTPGVQLESWPLTNIVPFPTGGLQTVTSALHTPLVQGVKYWVILTASDRQLGWYLNAQEVRGHWQFSDDGRQTWTQGDPTDRLDGALEVTTLAVAVPESHWIAAAGTVALAATALLTKRRRA
jgi:hypothetical protein